MTQEIPVKVEEINGADSYCTITIEFKTSIGGRSATFKQPKIVLSEVRGKPFPEDQLRKMVEKIFYHLDSVVKQMEEKFNV